MNQYRREDIFFNPKHPDRRYRLVDIHGNILELYSLFHAIKINISLDDVKESGYVVEPCCCRMEELKSGHFYIDRVKELYGKGG